MRRHGPSLFEVVVVVCIVAGLAYALMERLWLLQVEAERATMNHVVMSIKSALTLEIADYLSRGAEDQLYTEVLGSNPIDRLTEPPPSYVGSLERPDPGSVPPGSWYFDAQERCLVYRIRHVEAFETSLAGPARVRFKFVPVYDDSNRSGRYESRHDRLRGIRLASLESYRWGKRDAD